MKRESRLGPAHVQNVWMVSFTDMVMLIMAMFVLIFSMSSMDISVLERIIASLDSRSVHDPLGPARIDGRIRMLADIIMDRSALPEQEELIKDLLLPEDILPKKFDDSTLKRNIRVLTRPDGVAVIIGERLLFEKDSARLDAPARALVSYLTPLIKASGAGVVITGHSASPQAAEKSGAESSGADKTGEADAGGYALSSARALAVLKVFLRDGLPPHRFAAAGYGPDRPLAEGENPPGADLNGRVEILIKPSGVRAPGAIPADGGTPPEGESPAGTGQDITGAPD